KGRKMLCASPEHQLVHVQAAVCRPQNRQYQTSGTTCRIRDELTRACGQPANELAGAAGTAHPIRPAGGLGRGSAIGLGAELVQQTWQRPVVHDYNLPDSASTPESSAARQ